MKLQRELRCIAILAIAVLTAVVTDSVQAGEFKILPAKAKFTIKNVGNVEFENLSKQTKIVCTGLTGALEFTSERSGPFELKMTECEETGMKVKCGEGFGSNGKLTLKGEAHLRHLLGSGGTPEGVTLMLSPTQILFFCNPKLLLLRGEACSDRLAEHLLLSTWHAIYLIELIESKRDGDAVVRSIDSDSSLAMESCLLLLKESLLEGVPWESVGWSWEAAIENCEVGGVFCTSLVDLAGTF